MTTQALLTTKRTRTLNQWSYPAWYRLYRRIRRSKGCWLFLGSLTSDGYGNLLGPDKRVWRAHRLMWHLAYGSIPSGLHVLHHCDTRNCVRPRHLWIGTDRDNVHDAIQKGRFSLIPLARMTDEQRHKRVRHLLASRKAQAHWNRLRQFFRTTGKKLGSSEWRQFVQEITT